MLPNNCSNTDRPVKWESKLSNRTTSPTLSTNKASCPHDTSGDDYPGDLEMPPSPTNLIPQSPVTINNVTSQSRQSPKPPTARLAQLSNPPDEDLNGPKRVVAFGQRYQEQQTDNISPNVPSDKSANMSTASYSPRHRVELEGAAKGPRSIIPEETMDMPTSPQVNRVSIALTNRQIALDKMCQGITNNMYKLHKNYATWITNKTNNY